MLTKLPIMFVDGLINVGFYPMAVGNYRIITQNTSLGKYNPLVMENDANESCEFSRIWLFPVDLRSDNDLFRITISQPSPVITKQSVVIT